MPKPNPLLKAIDKQHQQLTELFLMHQEALLINRLPLANTIYQAYQALQMAHLTFENNHLLPCLEKLDETRWPSSLYHHEHNKVEDLLTKHAQHLSQAQRDFEQADTQNSTYRRWLIELLDQHKTLKGVLEHHEEREEQGMLKELGDALSQTELESLCKLLKEDTAPALDAIYDHSQQWMTELNLTA